MADERIRRLKEQFDAAHKKGMNGIASGDYDAVTEAVQRERDIIEEQAEVIAERQEATAHLRSVPARKADEHSDG